MKPSAYQHARLTALTMSTNGTNTNTTGGLTAQNSVAIPLQATEPVRILGNSILSTAGQEPNLISGPLGGGGGAAFGSTLPLPAGPPLWRATSSWWDPMDAVQGRQMEDRVRQERKQAHDPNVVNDIETYHCPHCSHDISDFIDYILDILEEDEDVIQAVCESSETPQKPNKSNN